MAPVISGECSFAEVKAMSVPDFFDLMEVIDIKNALSKASSDKKSSDI